MLSSFLCASFLFLCFSVQNLVAHGSHDLQTYIVHLEPPSNIKFNRKEEYENWCMSFLPPSYVRAKRLVHIYGEAIHGFAARLTEEEVAHMEKMEGFVSAYLDRVVPLHTTHTPEFLGLTTTQTNHDQVFGDGGKGTIVGVIDTGVTPDHPSFNGGDLPPPPSKWKGECNLPTELCNHKLIGFRSFLQGAMVAGHGKNDVNTTFDDVGHGTHTASTVAGAAVDNANILGEANGTAMGMAPRAHLAIYQVCSDFGCYTSDVLAGINTGIKDEIDVLSISLGGYSYAYYLDAIAIGAFRAMQKGIFVSCSAGNGGPYSYTISNEAPWTLTAGAGSTDRRIRSTVRLGDHQEFEGETLYQPQNFNSTLMRPLVLPNSDDDHIDIKDKIVFCGFHARFSTVCKDDVVKKVGGAGTIRVNTEIRGYNTFARNRSIPSPELNFADGIKVQNYIKATDNPNVTILFKHTVFNVTRSPSMAFFSSRGPGVMSPGILKPDIIGPGLNIIAAFPPREDSRAEAKFSEHSFTIMSGTSMSAPHLSGIAALLKSRHPDWSPAAIKSAIMTTANLLDRDGNSITNEKYVPANMFAIGAGHVNASNAINPGLIYDITPEDYISFLCQLNYGEKQLTTIVGHKVKCFELKKILIKDLNYPSISVTMEKSHKKEEEVIVTRTVTNVGQEKSIYVIKVDEPEGVSITVNPKMLAFSEVNEPITFNVTFEKKGPKQSSYSEGHLSWVSQENDVVVRIPISVKFD